ncbi:family 16 glycosylhydrolase [Roseivivax isoporae]|uniref:GH16 domain-containing protein n=1 Tax=Roseivivax isoporae LMG 25204 TaxID=1449351 RepID=X7F3A5_9RHOB|nr:family 16 glycosylhydrolase [Roseivivax isoporae]ETX27233.1 hypothetical protein RISW2_15035 [Roseivivax isoporae LMG 25204]
MTTITGTDGRDALRTGADGDRIEAGAGGDYIFNRHAGTVLEGGAGDDQYRLYDPDATVVETADGGHDTIWAWRSLTLPEHVEDAVFKGVRFWHSVEGNGLDNRISAGDGRQALAGRGGDDTLTGGGGRDTFHVEPGEGHDRITDFTPGTDILALWLPGFESAAAILDAAEDTGAGTLLRFGEAQSVLLEGVATADLTAADFGLGPSPLDLLDGRVPTFADEFDDAGTLAGGPWQSAPPNGHPVTAGLARGAREHTYLSAETGSHSPFSVEDGILSITARRTPEDLQDEVATDWVSGSLVTHGTFSQLYGYFEVRARIPEGQGFWPAFWLTRDDFHWPPEIDILEALGDQSTRYRAAVHSEIWGTKVTAAEQWIVPDTAADFHDYGVLWTPSELVFSFDGREMFRVPTPPDMHEPMALTLNLAVGGWTGGPGAGTPDAGAFEIDHVRVYDIPGIEEMPRSEDLGPYADLETGRLTTGAQKEIDLYGPAVRRVSVEGTPGLALAAGEDATLVGDGAANLLAGNALGTTFNGGAGDDTLRGEGGNDMLIGGDGDDRIEGGPGVDRMVGGAGDDTYVLRTGDGANAGGVDLVWERAGEGTDTLFLADARPEDVRSHVDWARWHVSIDTGTGTERVMLKATPGIGGHDVGTHVERVVFADGTVWDMTGGLFLFDDDGAHTSSGSVHADTILGAGGDDTLIGMDGDDLIEGGAGIDVLYGWNGDDILRETGSEGGNRLHGEAGADTLEAGDGGDHLDGGAGDDVLRGGAGNDTLVGGTGRDRVQAGPGADSLDGGAGADRLLGQDGGDTLDGGPGHDMLAGADGADRLSGGVGSDALWGGAGADTLDGGPGRDRLTGGAGDDVFAFRLGEMDGDRIADLEAEDRIEVAIASGQGPVSVVREGDALVFLDADGDVAARLLTEAGLPEDVTLIPL